VSVRPQALPSRSNLLRDWLGSARIPRHRKIYGLAQQITFRSKPIISAIMQQKSNAASVNPHGSSSDERAIADT
jgi:hypothetical protein